MGAQEFPPTNSLYASYKAYCGSREYEVGSWSNFCNQFLTTLRSLGVGASKIRKRNGRFLRGVSLVGGERVPPPDRSFTDKLREEDPFLY